MPNVVVKILDDSTYDDVTKDAVNPLFNIVNHNNIEKIKWESIHF